ncbi:hypothetical protein CYMTET_54073 [Cymbomonas tetramitiformis]|uniref:Ribosomal biogenesis protein LAS1L n=1 Tax=Cymbomonas tetramitiformis TaxID=36881 RepID=A0AAE0BHH8_9CHLO|nr:hypothetical protein CYMTET_54073 [Cymbomonas tetramitiformis]
MATGRTVPWASWIEWANVYNQLFSSRTCDVTQGLQRVAAWRARRRLPTSVEITAALLDARMLDSDESEARAAGSTSRSLYAMAIIRMVNQIVDPSQKGRYAASVQTLADTHGLPRVLVDLRHEATHKGLPSLLLLRHASSVALDWLRHNYWDAQNKRLLECKDGLQSLLVEYTDILVGHDQEAAERPSPGADEDDDGSEEDGQHARMEEVRSSHGQASQGHLSRMPAALSAKQVQGKTGSRSRTRSALDSPAVAEARAAAVKAPSRKQRRLRVQKELTSLVPLSLTSMLADAVLEDDSIAVGVEGDYERRALVDTLSLTYPDLRPQLLLRAAELALQGPREEVDATGSSPAAAVQARQRPQHYMHWALHLLQQESAPEWLRPGLCRVLLKRSLARSATPSREAETLGRALVEAMGAVLPEVRCRMLRLLELRCPSATASAGSKATADPETDNDMALQRAHQLLEDAPAAAASCRGVERRRPACSPGNAAIPDEARSWRLCEEWTPCAIGLLPSAQSTMGELPSMDLADLQPTAAASLSASAIPDAACKACAQKEKRLRDVEAEVRDLQAAAAAINSMSQVYAGGRGAPPLPHDDVADSQTQEHMDDGVADEEMAVPLAKEGPGASCLPGTTEIGGVFLWSQADASLPCSDVAASADPKSEQSQGELENVKFRASLADVAGIQEAVCKF